MENLDHPTVYDFMFGSRVLPNLRSIGRSLDLLKGVEGVGQRVQKSVFECRVDRMQYEDLERRLLQEINEKEDNLRLYRLAEGRGCEVKEHGFFKATDFDAPLVV